MRSISIAKQYFGGLAILALAFPIWARPQSTRTFTADWTADQAMKIGSAQIEPGDYTLQSRENSNTLDVMQNGRVVAQLQCHWVEQQKKAVNTEVDTDNNQIVRVEFAGKTEAIQIP
jgi:hypothetical protein